MGREGILELGAVVDELGVVVDHSGVDGGIEGERGPRGRVPRSEGADVEVRADHAELGDVGVVLRGEESGKKSSCVKKSRKGIKVGVTRAGGVMRKRDK
jgi:hypothetical protein